MSLIIDPITFKLYPKTPQAIIMVKQHNIFSSELVGNISPYPTVILNIKYI
jgi:hypothetical protein